MDEYENCPVCNKSFPIALLIPHAERCTGESYAPQDERMDLDVPENDDDFQLALKLQKEEEEAQKQANKRQNTNASADEAFAKTLQEQERAKTQTSTVKCQLCSSDVNLDFLYILDDCTHRFCQTCIRDYVAQKVSTSVTLECPLKDCKKPLSVRDMKDLLPKITKQQPGFLNPTKGTGKAAERIMAEMKHIMKSEPEKNGYSVEPINDNLYKWELKFFNFDKTDPLGQDMATYRIKNILLHISFPPNYPFSPPYIRVIKPRFVYRTGHVTIGGSICMEMLTNKGWSPANTVEAIVVSIRAQLIEGNARLDPKNKSDYTEQEAKEAFDRMVRDHNWY